jgi:hypothetical protein
VIDFRAAHVPYKMVRFCKKRRHGTEKVGVIEPGLKNRRLLRTQLAYQCQQHGRVWPMSAYFQAGHWNTGLRERLRHRPWLQKRNDLILKLIAIHRRDQIDQAALGTTGVEAGNQVADSNRQGPALGQDTAPLQERDHTIGEVFGVLIKRVQDQFGGLRRFVGRIQTGEIA